VTFLFFPLFSLDLLPMDRMFPFFSLHALSLLSRVKLLIFLSPFLGMES